MDNTYVHYYAQLPERLRRDVYMPLLTALRSHQMCALPFVTVGEVETVLDCIQLEQPILSSYREYNYRTFRSLVFSVEPQYLLSAERQRAVSDGVRAAAARIAAYARTVSDDPAMQFCAVYDRLSAHVTYDSALHSYAFCAAGALLYASAACLGIALGLKAVCDELGIPTVCVRGEHEGEPHAWSLVRLYGRWWPTDLTVGVCRSTPGYVCRDGLCALPEPEKYRAWERFRYPGG